MQLVFPGFWNVVLMIGLLLSFVGSSLLAYLSTNSGQKTVRRIVRGRTSPERYGYSYLERTGKISKDNKSRNDEDSFKGLVEFILSMYRRGEYTIPRNPEVAVKRVELRDTRQMDDEVVLVFEEDIPGRVLNTKTSTTNMSIEDLGAEIERNSEIKREEFEDLLARRFWEVFATGVLFQLIGFFVENFVIW